MGLDADSFDIFLLPPFPLDPLADLMRRQVLPLDDVDVPTDAVVLTVDIPAFFCFRSSDAFGLLVALDCLLLLPLRNMLQLCNRFKTAGTDRNLCLRRCCVDVGVGDLDLKRM